jgi:hypothetical protein
MHVYDSSKTAARFWRKVDRSGDCWLWTAGVDRRGYGRFNVGDGRSPQFTHRFAFELTHGPIPAGMHVLHHCDNPPCCNPAHLYLGTDADNHRDMMERGRSTTGERDAMAKLTAEQVIAIRQFVPQRRGDLAQLARTYGVTHGAITQIRSGQRWRHLSTH